MNERESEPRPVSMEDVVRFASVWFAEREEVAHRVQGRRYGWELDTQPRQFIDTRNFRFLALCNGPILVDRRTGNYWVKPTGEQLVAGAETLIRLIDLMPKLRVAFLQGNDAVAGWKKVRKLAPSLVEDRQLTVVTSIHPGLQGLWTPDPDVRAARITRQDAAYAEVRRLIGR